MDYLPIDADNHYYEPIDAFTRHLDKKFTWRGVHPVQDGKRIQLLIGGKVNRFVPNPTFDPIIVPGCLDAFFRGQISADADRRELKKVERIRVEYRDRASRLKIVDEQGLGAVLLFPTLGCGVEQALRNDVDATMASLHAFNRWLEDDWGFNHEGKLIGVPMLSLADPLAACEELDSLLERGARMVHIRPAPVPNGNGTSRSLGHPTHDPVWARLAAAGVPVAFHLGDSGYNMFAAAWGGAAEFEGYGEPDPLGSVLVSDRAIQDTIASLVVDRVFTRHPKLKVASIENGSDFIYPLVKHLKKQANQTPWAFPDDPLDVIREHVYVAPYFEEDLKKLVDILGVNRVLFGSDWPHGEGLAVPKSFAHELEGLGDVAIRRVMRDNCLELLGAES